MAAAAVVAAALAVTTSGERARAVTRELVDSVVAGDLVAAVDLFSDDATVSLGSTTSPAYDRDVIVSGLDRATRYDVADNRIRALRAYTVSGDEAEVLLHGLLASTLQCGVLRHSRLREVLVDWVHVHRYLPPAWSCDGCCHHPFMGMYVCMYVRTYIHTYIHTYIQTV